MKMVATRQDAWSEDDDLLLAEVTLRHIREGGTQLAAFEEVGYRLQRTAAACGFRWNSLVRKKYESAIQIAKAQRQQRKARGKSRFFPETSPSYGTELYASESTASPQVSNNSQNNSHTQYNFAEERARMKEYSAPTQPASLDEREDTSYQSEFGQELNGISLGYGNSSQNSNIEELNFDDVIRFLRNQKESYKKYRNVDKELRDREREIERLRDENQRMKKELDSMQSDFQTVNEDYKSLIKIMDRARKLAFLGEEEQEEKVSFKMDRNGNLERVDKS
jgi:prespore-specific regulator